MRREVKSLRIGVHHANAVVWGPVSDRTHLVVQRATARHAIATAMTCEPCTRSGRRPTTSTRYADAATPDWSRERRRVRVSGMRARDWQTSFSRGETNDDDDDLRASKASRCVGIESEGWAESDERRERKSLRIGVHHADGVVRGPV